MGEQINQITAEEVKGLKQQLVDKDKLIASLNDQLKKKEAEVNEAQAIAKEAIDKYNALMPQIPVVPEVKLKSKRIAVVNFGVQYKSKKYSKEELLEAPEVVEQLLKIGSGAVSLKED